MTQPSQSQARRTVVRSVLVLAAAATSLAFAVPSGGAPAATGPAAAPSAGTPDVRVAKERKAFPGAEGFGTGTPGGRGGRVIRVTTLADSGPGSLRAALAARGPRIIVFAVSGTMTLQRGIAVTRPYVTLAGQSAPGGGITLRVDPCNDDAALGVHTHDVVIRHLRVRRGANTCGGQGDTADGIVVYKKGAHHVVVDHSSVSWAVDENLSTYDDAKNVTFSWNIVSEGLSHSTHPEGEHSKGVHLSGERSGRISFHHNLLAHNNDRNPQATNPGIADIRNNVVYNYGDNAALASNSHGRPEFNFVGNYYIPGPDTDRSEWELDVYDGGGAGWAFFTKGNRGPHRRSNDAPQTRAVSPEGRSSVVSSAFPVPGTDTTSAATAYRQVLAGAGATRPVRDAVDLRIVREVRDRSGHIIDDPSQVGGWPVLSATAAPPDGDRDGVPDAWENAHDTLSGVKDSSRDADGDGWTNVEEWLNALARG